MNENDEKIEELKEEIEKLKEDKWKLNYNFYNGDWGWM